MLRTALLLIVVSLCAARVRAAEVTLVLDGLESEGGDVQVDLFAESNAANFPYAERGVLFEIKCDARALRAAGAAIPLGDLAPGRYALFAMHDENANGDLDRNFLGIPTERYGFSNGARGTVGPPSFDAAAVQIGGDAPSRIVVHLGR